MRQIPLITSAPAAAPADVDVDRDLFGNPIPRTGPAAPTYRPRKPVQQSLDLTAGAFSLTAPARR